MSKFRLGQKLDFEQEMKALILLLGLCPSCADQVRLVMEQMSTTPGRLVRDKFWNWMGNWPHGNECPPEELARWHQEARTVAVSPSDAGAEPVGVGATEDSSA